MHCHSSAAVQAIIPSAVFIASLLGSSHCVMMCGGLVLVTARSWRQQIFYHLGRLASYVILGWVSGWISGTAVIRLPQFFGEGLMIAIGAGLIALGIAGLFGRWHFALPGSALMNDWVVRTFRRLVGAESTHSQSADTAGLLGLLSIFLPCGWLYGFVLASLSLADPVKGALVMIAFWAGTVPALALSPLILRKFFSVTGSWAPKIAALFLILAGILPLWMRYSKFL